jgi:hypothetical protein
LNEIFVSAIADECRLIPDRLEVDLLPRTAHFCKLLLIGEDSIQSLRNLVDVEESHWQRSTIEGKSGSNTKLTDEMAKPSTQLDFGLHKNISVAFKGHE